MITTSTDVAAGVRAAAPWAEVIVAGDGPGARALHGRAGLCALVIDGAAVASLGLDHAALGVPLGPDELLLVVGDARRARESGEALGLYLRARGELEAALAELSRQVLGSGHTLDCMLGSDPLLLAVKEQIRGLRRFPQVPVLILGETGVGKELAAEAIHELSAPPGSPYVAVNCAAIPEALFESELFGHAAGAYTGARGARRGLLEAAAAGTIFLDEIGELPALLQPKLLRALESRSFRPVGSDQPLALRARVISATNRGGGEALPLRRDLYYRVAGFTLLIPSLRERIGDVAVLARSFLSGVVRRPPMAMTLSDRAVAALERHDWPGNVRELRAVVQQAAILAPTRVVDEPHVQRALRAHAVARAPERPAPAVDPNPLSLLRDGRGLPELERELVVGAYHDAHQNLSQAARLLGIPRTTLRSKLQRYGLIEK